MSELAIAVENLGKEYHIGARQAGYQTVRESLVSWARSWARMGRRWWSGNGAKSRGDQSVWALRDVSFEIRQGDVVGVVGRNGAGKSTLLKILSRITNPTTGFADVVGRVGSLLEVGTGFHPELTGRENIFLNGAILGMGRAEISRKFDEIVDFSGVEKFIDTPVKHYSSGMYLRLAFAVAAHLEPEILLVDEVLAVGDASFQKKCLGRMEAVANEGRTVLFVSHNMGAIRSLCNKGLFLDEGTVRQQGDVHESIALYFQSIGATEAPDAGKTSANSRTGFGRVQLHQAQGNTLHQSQAIDVSTTFNVQNPMSGFYLFCILEDMFGQDVFHLQESSMDLSIVPGQSRYDIRVKVPPLWLVPGLYMLHFKVVSWGTDGSKYVSDKYPVDIVGASSSSNQSRCLLHPQVTWDIA